MTTLSEVAPGIAVWAGQGPPGEPNATVVVDDDALTLVDALLSPTQAVPFAEACNTFGPPVRRLVLTSSHVEYVGGSAQFPLAAVYGTPQISAHLDQPPNTDGYRRLYPGHADEFDDLTTRPVSHTVTEAAWISGRAVAVPVTGELDQNLVVQIPDNGVVICGAMATFGTTPLMFDGDPAAWHAALDVIVGYGSIFVPGHGPVGTADDIRTLQAYIEACIDADGDIGALGLGPWDHWHAPEFHTVNVERAAMLAAGDPSPPPSMLRLLGMA